MEEYYPGHCISSSTEAKQVYQWLSSLKLQWQLNFVLIKDSVPSPVVKNPYSCTLHITAVLQKILIKADPLKSLSHFIQYWSFPGKCEDFSLMFCMKGSFIKKF